MYRVIASGYAAALCIETAEDCRLLQ